MDGFDPKFRDFPDFIIGITKEIWEDRRIAMLHEYYGKDIVVRSPSSVVVGNGGVIDATLETLAEFPDRVLYGEDVIWSGTPEAGMLSSHRIMSHATHLGDGKYGKATGKALRYRILADCHARNNVIDDEWLIRDQGAIVRQLGWDPRDYARGLILREGGPESCAKPFTPANDVVGPYSGTGNDDPWGERYAHILTQIMKADLSVVAREYDRAVQSHYPGGLEAHSTGPVDRFWVRLRAAFPSAHFDIHHRIGREDRSMPPRAAIRWSLTGRHDGWGAFGAPTGAEVHVMGISQAEFGPWGLRREFTLYDEAAIWKQILLATGDVPESP